MSDFDSLIESSGCASSGASPQPDKFTFENGGSFGARDTVQWNGHALHFSNNADINRIILPADQQWREFWVAMEKVQLWKWQPNYHNPNIRDGWQWYVEITHGPLKVDAWGQNAVPDDQDVTKTVKAGWPNKTFRDFQSAVEGLIGCKMRSSGPRCAGGG